MGSLAQSLSTQADPSDGAASCFHHRPTTVDSAHSHGRARPHSDLIRDTAINPRKVRHGDFPAISHAAVMVTDVARSTRRYTALIGSDPALDEDESKGAYHHTVWALPTGQLFGIHTHHSAGGASFDESNVGLDHRL
jgi:hypothetical protein